MTAKPPSEDGHAVPDPRECQTCGYDEANHKREAHLYRPATVPDPRFRDQLAEALLLGSGGRQYWNPQELRDIVDDLAPLVEARESVLRHQLDTALGSLEIHREAADRDNAKLRAVEELADRLRDESRYLDPFTARIGVAERIREALAAS